jgi:transcriptional regulator with XRE-family HTH domain
MSVTTFHELRDLRRARGLSQADLADAARIDEMTVSRLERGDLQRHPHRVTLDALARVLGVAPDHIHIGTREGAQ